MRTNKFGFKDFVTIMLLIICLVSVGLTDYITAGFDSSIFKTYTFWINIGTTNCCAISVVLIIIIVTLDSLKMKSTLYNDLQNELYDGYNSKSYIDSLFKIYSSKRTINNKIEAHKRRVNKKYSKLKPKASDLNIYLHGDDVEKQNNEYCKKAMKYDILLSDEYINSNIYKIKVPHNIITASLIFSGVHSSGDRDDFVTKHKTAKIASRILPKFLVSIIMTTLYAMVAISFKDGITTAAVINTVVKVFSISLNYFFATNTAIEYYENVILHDLRFRVTVYKDYITWVNSQSSKEVVNNGRKEISSI